MQGVCASPGTSGHSAAACPGGTLHVHSMRCLLPARHVEYSGGRIALAVAEAPVGSQAVYTNGCWGVEHAVFCSSCQADLKWWMLCCAAFVCWRRVFLPWHCHWLTTRPSTRSTMRHPVRWRSRS